MAWAAATCAFSAAKRSYPTSEIRGRSPEDPIARGEVAKRNYPTSEVRGSGQECQAAMAQEQLRGATLRPRLGALARRTYAHAPEARSRS